MLKIMCKEEMPRIPGGYVESLTEFISEVLNQNKMGFFSYFESAYDDLYYHSHYYHEHEHCYNDRVWSG